MRNRIFIAINIPENIKKQLTDQQYKWLDLPCRWTKSDSLHITLSFLGGVNDEELPEICRICSEVAQRHSQFSITLNKIIYGPTDKSPRMVWVGGDKNDFLSDLQKDLEDSLAGLSIKEVKEDARHFTSHITLGRLKQWEFKTIEPEERPQVNEEINLSFEVKSIEIMNSQLKRGGSEYGVLESFQLKS
jgi:2'-5' RNA ligase